MHIRSILAIARKDALDVLVNKSKLVMLLMPLFIAGLFVLIDHLIGSHTTNLLIYNPGKSGVQQVIAGAFSDSKITYANSPADMTTAFGPDGSHKDTAYAVGLVVPSDFDVSLHNGGHPQLILYVDGSQINTIQRQLLLQALTDYARSVANPQPPASIDVATVNPPSPSSNITQDVSQFYSIVGLQVSFIVGAYLLPGIIVEEKEKKTLRMLMVSPASYSDVIAGKLLVGLAYQLVLAAGVLAISGGFSGQILLVMLFALLGSCFGVTLGLLIGSVCQTTSTAEAAGAISLLIYMLPIFFAGTLAQFFGNNPFAIIIKVLPSYYIVDGASNALQNQATFSGTLVDVSVALGATVALLLIAVWTLQRQASVMSTI